MNELSVAIEQARTGIETIPTTQMAAQVVEVETFASAAIVKDEQTAAAANDLSLSINKRLKAFDAERKKAGDPFRAIVETVNGIFKPLTTRLEEAKKGVDAKILAYRKAEAMRIAEENARLERERREAEQRAVAERKRLEEEQQQRELEAFENGTEAPVPIQAPVVIVPEVVPIVQAKVVSSLGSGYMKSTYKAVVENAALVPESYKKPDIDLLNDYAAMCKKNDRKPEIPGVRFDLEEKWIPRS